MVSFCETFLLLGECTIAACKYRHVLTAMDRSDAALPRSGSVKLQITYTHSPTHYAARILEHKPLNAKIWAPFMMANSYLQFSMEFMGHYGNVNNHISHYPIRVGDLCTIADDAGSAYHRCKVLEIK